ncbi:MAG TPA: aminoglycoside phosphotransferase family protein [Ruminiclostridium sp.]|nr:aminoglycoside phosphotransferase family protein [Ruminiclostridium sp.]
MDNREAKYTNYIKDKFPQLDLSKAEYNFTDGKHCDIVIIDKKDVFKFSRYDWSAGHVENEVAVINVLSKNIPIPLQKVTSMEKGIARFTYIKGEPLYRNILFKLGNRTQETIAEQLGVFLRLLHSIPLKGEDHKKISECPTAMSREDWLARYEEIERKVFPYCDSYSKEYYRQIFKPLLENGGFMEYHPSLIHGDLMPYHILVDKATDNISGIIDFGMSGMGDPAYDVGIVLDNLGEAFVRRMSRYYKNIQNFIDRARFYAYTNNLIWAKNVSDMLATRDFTNFRIIAKERDIMPIGTKWVDK